jgi:hypothetical protein
LELAGRQKDFAGAGAIKKIWISVFSILFAVAEKLSDTKIYFLPTLLLLPAYIRIESIGCRKVKRQSKECMIPFSINP